MAHVSTVQPAIAVQSLGGPLRVLQVSFEHTGASHTDLTAVRGVGMSDKSVQDNLRTCSPPHLRSLRSSSSRVCPPASPWSRAAGHRHDLMERDFINILRRWDLNQNTKNKKTGIGRRPTCAPVSRHGECAACCALRLSVALKDETAQSGSEEGQHGGGDGGRSSQDKPQVPSKTGLKHEQCRQELCKQTHSWERFS